MIAIGDILEDYRGIHKPRGYHIMAKLIAASTSVNDISQNGLTPSHIHQTEVSTSFNDISQNGLTPSHIQQLYVECAQCSNSETDTDDKNH